ncbi:MAG: hypothetical protein WAM11_02380 [Cyanobium sp.]
MKPSAWLLCTTISLSCYAGLPIQVSHAGEVIILRHGDKDKVRGDFNLSPKGFLRAIALARLIPGCFGNPSGISTYYLDPDTSKNARSYQTAVPLGVYTGVNIRVITDSPERSFYYGRETREAIEGSNRLQVLFWEHRRMPLLAQGLGWKAMPQIPDDDFDQLILLHYSKPGKPPRVERFSQNTLFRSTCFAKALKSLPLDVNIAPLLDIGSNSGHRGHK